MKTMLSDGLCLTYGVSVGTTMNEDAYEKNPLQIAGVVGLQKELASNLLLGVEVDALSYTTLETAGKVERKMLSLLENGTVSLTYLL